MGNYLVYASDCADPGIMLNPAKSLFAGYVRSSEIYKDPGSSGITHTGDSAPAEKNLPRSYALNCWMGPSKGNDLMRQRLSRAGRCKEFIKSSDLTSSASSRLLTFLDVHPDSICSPCFGTFVTRPGEERIWNYPASYHDGRGVCAYADGHVQTQQWRDPGTRGSVLDYHFGPYGHNHPSPNNIDMLWLGQHATDLE